MELLQLRYFYESAMEGSFSKIARKYMVPVSSVSASVKRLEQEIGTELFARTGNRILLTEKGRQFLTAVGDSLAQLDTGVNRLLSGQSTKGTLSILARCTRETLTWYIMKFHQLYPSVCFKLTFDDLPENYDRYDLIVSDPEEGFGDYMSFQWRNFAMHVVAAETEPLCRGTVTLSQLKEHLFVITSSQRGGFKLFAQACKQRGFAPKVLLECDDYRCRNRALNMGGCLGLNVGNDDDTRLPGLRYLSVPDFNAQFVVNVYYKKEKYHGNTELFADFLKNSVV